MTKLEQLKAQYEAKLSVMTSQAKENLEIARLEGKLSLVSNDQYMTAKVKREHKAENLTYLQTLLISLNALPDIKMTGSSDSFRMRAYPVGEAQFGMELASLLGVVTSAQQAYAEEHRDAVQALLNCSMIDLEDTVLAFGKVSYFSKNSSILVDEQAGDYQSALASLTELAETIGLPHPIDTSKFTEVAYNNYFANARRKAQAKADEFRTSMEIDTNNQFTLTRVEA